MTINEIVGRLKAGGLDASSKNRGAAVYVADAREDRALAGWFAFHISCDSEATERRSHAILSRFYDIEASGNVWRLRSKNRVPLMAVKRGGASPTAADYLYFEAVEADSTVSFMSSFQTAPNLEYSADGVTWQEWPHTTQTDEFISMHVFDTITLGEVGDRVYLKGVNPSGFYNDFENFIASTFSFSGRIAAGGNAQTLVDGDTPTLVAKPMPLFGYGTGLVSPPALPATTLADGCYQLMFAGCTSLTAAPALPATTLADGCYYAMFEDCNFDMSSDGETFNFEFGAAPPVTVEGETLATYYDIASWMGNTNGFN